MIYAIVKILLRITLPVFYKKIQFKNLENLPVDQPVIIASNHPNAFMDAMVPGTFTKQKVHFMVRSDVFKNRLARWFFTELNMVPIYRLQEGIENLHKNIKTFRLCSELLGRNESIVIFPEGLCIQERRLRPLKRGSARIVFGTAESGLLKKDLIVFPVGINYEKPKNFRSRIFVNYGSPIKISDFIEQYQNDKALAANEFTRELEKRISALIIHIDNKVNDKLVENIEEIYRKQWLQSKGLNPENTEDRYHATREIVRVINQVYQKDPEKVEKLKLKVYPYIKKLEEMKLRDHLLQKASIESLSSTNLVRDIFFLCAGFPIHVIGLLINYAPYRMAYRIADKKVKNVEFHSSINVVAGMFLFLIFYTLYVILFALIVSNIFYVAGFILLILLLAKFNLFFWPEMKKCMGRMRLRKLLSGNKRKMVALIRQRNEIISEFEEMKNSVTA